MEFPLTLGDCDSEAFRYFQRLNSPKNTPLTPERIDSNWLKGYK